MATLKLQDVVESKSKPGRVGRVIKLHRAAKAVRVLWADGTESVVGVDVVDPPKDEWRYRVPTALNTIIIKRRFAAVVREAMDEQNLSWDVVAQRTGVSKASLGRCLRNDDKHWLIETIEAFSRGLGIEPGRFWSVGK
jgi:hypothetical protein